MMQRMRVAGPSRQVIVTCCQQQHFRCSFHRPQRKLQPVLAGPAPFLPEKPQSTLQSLKRQLAQPGLLAALPLASTSATTLEIYGAVAKALDVYLVLLMVRVLLTWFKGVNWGGEPFNTLRQFTDPFLNVWRGIVPPIAGIDLSVMLGFFILSFARNALRKLSYGLPVF